MIGGHCRDTTLKRRLVSGRDLDRYEDVLPRFAIWYIHHTNYYALDKCPCESQVQVCGLLPIHDTHLHSYIIIFDIFRRTKWRTYARKSSENWGESWIVRCSYWYNTVLSLPLIHTAVLNQWVLYCTIRTTKVQLYQCTAGLMAPTTWHLSQKIVEIQYKFICLYCDRTWLINRTLFPLSCLLWILFHRTYSRRIRGMYSGPIHSVVRTYFSPIY